MTEMAAPPVVEVRRQDLHEFSAPTALEQQISILRRWAMSRRLWLILCVVCYFALAVIAYLPVSPFDARQLPIAGIHNPAGADPFQMTWFLSWTPFALSHGLSPFHTNFIDYPTGVNLADNTTVPLLGILGWPITATLGPVATFNVLIRLSFAISATAMFFVMRRWCSSIAAPFLAGLLYAFGPYTTGQKLHLDLIFIPFIPILVLLFDELFHRQKMRAATLGILIGLVSGLQYFVSQEVLSGCFALLVVASLGLGIRFRHELRSRIGYISKALLFGLLIFAVLAGYPLYEMLFGAGHLHGPVVTLGALQSISSDLLSPLIPTSNQLAAGGFVTHFGDELVFGNLSENSGYLGIPLLIVIALVIRRLRKDITVMTFFWLAVAAFVLSLGSNLVIGTWRSSIPLPEDLFTRVPFFQSTVPARYSLYVLLFLAMAVGIGFDRLWFAPHASEAARVEPRSGVGSALKVRAEKWRTRSPALWFGISGAIVFGSLLPNAPFASRGLVWPASLPREIARVVRPGSVVLAYPYPDPNVPSMQPMAWQAIDHIRFRLIGGYANIEVPGQGVGQRWPLVYRPRSVQTILGYTSFGDRFPQPPVATPAIEAQVRPYLAKYSVGAVVAWFGLGNPSPNLIEPDGIYAYASRWINALGRAPVMTSSTGVYEYLTRALGNPQIEEKSYAIWLPTHGSWTPRQT